MPDSQSATDDVTQEALLVEYQSNVALWRHDDQLRQQRNSNFLTVSALLIAALGAIVGLKAPLSYVGIIAMMFAAFGILICRVWYSIQARNAEYVRFRRFQLRSIEARLPDLSTFRNTFDAFYRSSEVDFSDIGESFRIKGNARKPSTLTEGSLPLLIAGLWVAVALAGAAVALLALADVI